MKISEVSKKVCPFIQDAFWSIEVNNIPRNMPKNINCICGDCMAWVYTEEYRLVDELCMSFTNDVLDESSYEISQKLTPSHHRISGGSGSSTIGGIRHEAWARKIEIAEHEKSGYCKRIGQ